FVAPLDGLFVPPQAAATKPMTASTATVLIALLISPLLGTIASLQIRNHRPSHCARPSPPPADRTLVDRASPGQAAGLACPRHAADRGRSPSGPASPDPAARRGDASAGVSHPGQAADHPDRARSRSRPPHGREVVGDPA